MTLREVAILLRPVKTRLDNVLARGVLKLLDDSKKVQIAQALVGKEETRDELERLQEYGFTSVPQDGAELVIGFVGGRRDHGVVLKCDDRRYRVTGLQKGEVAVYTDQGDKVVFKRGGTIEFTASTKVQINAPLVELQTDLKVNGDVNCSGTVTGTTDVVGGGKSLKNHTHTAGSFSITEGAVNGQVDPVTGSSGAPS